MYGVAKLFQDKYCVEDLMMPFTYLTFDTLDLLHYFIFTSKPIHRDAPRNDTLTWRPSLTHVRQLHLLFLQWRRRLHPLVLHASKIDTNLFIQGSFDFDYFHRFPIYGHIIRDTMTIRTVKASHDINKVELEWPQVLFELNFERASNQLKDITTYFNTGSLTSPRRKDCKIYPPIAPSPGEIPVNPLYCPSYVTSCPRRFLAVSRGVSMCLVLFLEWINWISFYEVNSIQYLSLLA